MTHVVVAVINSTVCVTLVSSLTLGLLVAAPSGMGVVLAVSKGGAIMKLRC